MALPSDALDAFEDHLEEAIDSLDRVHAAAEELFPGWQWSGEIHLREFQQSLRATVDMVKAARGSD